MRTENVPAARHQGTPGSRALTWGALLGVSGIVLYVIGMSMGGDAATKSALLTAGLLQGVAGLLIIAAVITVVVGVVRRVRSE